MKKIRTFLVFLSLIFLLMVLNSGYTVAYGRISLNEKEKAFINDHPEIRLGVDPSFIPYEFIDKDGSYKGIAADYIKIICERTGLNLVVEQNLTWPEAYGKALMVEVDVLSCISKTEERTKLFLYSDAYNYFQRAIFIKKNNQDIKSFEDLLNKRISVQTNSSHHSFLNQFDDIQLNLYSSVRNALAAVASDKEIAFVGNLATSNYFINLNGIPNLKPIEIEMGTDNGLYFAVRKDWPELVSILNKGLASISHEERINIENKWKGEDDQQNYKKFVRTISIIGSIVFFAFILYFYWTIKIKQENTLRKKAEEDLKLLKDEAELSNEYKSLFLARMSHEIRTPLNAISGMTYLLTKTEITQLQKVYLGKISQAAKNMLGIINDILDFSKIEAGKIELEHVPFYLDEVLDQVVNIISYRVEEQGIDFSINKNANVPNCFIGDSLRIQQILINIINNAIKFTKEGSVQVSISLVQIEEESCILKFKVKDTGIGMTKEQMNLIFEPFDQGDSSISRKFGGTGLGLTISKTLIELMSGTIQINSAENVGSVFTFQLTLVVDTIQQNRENALKSSVDFRHLRVLVIEKGALYNNVLREYLEAFHINAEYTNSGAEGLDRLEFAARKECRPFDLLLLDYNTPIEGGIEFYQKLSKTIYPIPKCILMIPISREYLIENLESVGIDFGIIKPFLPSTLFNSILEIMKDKVLNPYPETDNTADKNKKIMPNSHHILVVEDNNTNQMIAQTILNQAGYKVTLADNGKEGYELYVEHYKEIDLILMDIHMPVLNGFECSKLVRELDKNIPIVAMTADVINGVEDNCRTFGINYYISKPFDPDEFIATIQSVLEENKARNNNGIEMQDNSTGILEIDMEDGIRRIGGNKDIYYQILNQFRIENKAVYELIQAVVKNGDFEEAVQIVHKLKGSSGNIGAKDLYHITSELHSALKQNNTSKIDQYLSLLGNHLSQVLTEINSIV